MKDMYLVALRKILDLVHRCKYTKMPPDNVPVLKGRNYEMNT